MKKYLVTYSDDCRLVFLEFDDKIKAEKYVMSLLTYNKNTRIEFQQYLNIKLWEGTLVKDYDKP
jgi:hypothetical protein